MSQNAATETLIKTRDKLILEKEQSIATYNSRINEIEVAIERIEGRKVWETEDITVYDDTDPNHIKSSQEEI